MANDSLFDDLDLREEPAAPEAERRTEDFSWTRLFCTSTFC